MRCGCSWQYQCPLCNKCYQHDHETGENENGQFWICPSKKKHRISCSGEITHVNEES